MNIKITPPQTVVGSNGRGKSEEQLKANYENYYNRRFDLELLRKVWREEKNRLIAGLSKDVARSLERERQWAGGGA